MKCPDSHRSERGAAAVEFAIVALLLISLLLGILEFGWAFMGRITLTGAVREGARIAAVSTDEAAIREAVEDHSTTFTELQGFQVIRTGDTVEVRVTGRLRPLVGFFRTEDWSFEADATMRREYAN